MLGYNQWCPKCKSGKGIVKLTIPYAAKLLIQEVSAFSLLMFVVALSPLWAREREDCVRWLKLTSAVDGDEHHAEAMFGGYRLVVDLGSGI